METAAVSTTFMFAGCPSNLRSYNSTTSVVFKYSSTSERTMESPHEQQQSLLLSRIISNVEKLNEAVMVLNNSLQEVNVENMNIELVAQMFKNYQSNVLFHLEATEDFEGNPGEKAS
ncbi:DASH complex, subunit Dad4 [Ascosphaera apis ARSEF 7405]|uniref:DASH complex subunit DAD4 n=1 Tax=Ascosphaera apis ARSEF 7405 TaxID=392613 RepID=A0A167XZZ0_9EURO|nr:DASH complex, subunit Dad4 [Ascosphaera apis ARSEF 7405]